MTTIAPLETPLLECSVCGWLAYEGDKDRYCQQHNNTMRPPLDPRLTEGQQQSLLRRWAAKDRIMELLRP